MGYFHHPRENNKIGSKGNEVCVTPKYQFHQYSGISASRWEYFPIFWQLKCGKWKSLKPKIKAIPGDNKSGTNYLNWCRSRMNWQWQKEWFRIDNVGGVSLAQRHWGSAQAAHQQPSDQSSRGPWCRPSSLTGFNRARLHSRTHTHAHTFYPVTTQMYLTTQSWKSTAGSCRPPPRPSAPVSTDPPKCKIQGSSVQRVKLS